MKIIHMISVDNKDTWVGRRARAQGLRWYDSPDLVLALAQPHTETHEIREVFQDDLVNCDEGNMAFNVLWNDEGSPQQILEAFNILFEEFACDII